MENTNQNPPILPPPLPTKKWYQHKGLIAIVILAFLVAVFAWIYFANEPGQNVRPIVVHHKTTPTAVPISISTSQVYTNKTYGYQFEYPTDWTVSQQSDDAVTVNSATTTEEKVKDPYSEYPGDVQVFVDQNQGGLSAQQFYNGSNGEVLFDNPQSDTITQIAGTTAYKNFPIASMSGGEVIIIPQNNYFIRIEVNSDSQVPDQIISTFQFTSSSTSTDDQLNFPVPAMYSKDAWRSASASSSEIEYGEFYINDQMLSLTGQFYEATNTDPDVLAWEQSNANGTNEDGGFYGGDQEFLAYYDRALTNAGYETTIGLDQNLNVIQNWPLGTNQDSPAYNPTYIMIPSSGDGPLGTITGYIKYYQGKIRVIDISSSTTKNELFISDVVSLQSLISSGSAN